MKIHKNYDLSKLNTFGVKAKAKFFLEINNEQDLLELFALTEFKNNPRLFLGGGSNVLFTKDFPGLVVLNRLSGTEIIKENEEEVWVKAKSGEPWNFLVNFCVERNFWGIENLSLIYGTVGAAPVQNIGAYGVELKDILDSVETFDLETGKKKIFSKEECDFGYRESVFKKKLKGKYFISAVILKLSKVPKLNITYKALQDYVEKNEIKVKNAKEVSEVVAKIRRSKLPEPRKLGNAGSFFKNVYIDSKKLKELQKNYPAIPFYEEREKIKIPTAWLVEECGWKGKRVGKTGVHEEQALVLVNYGGASGAEILDLANKIIDSVSQKFGLKLEPEVNLI